MAAQGSCHKYSFIILQHHLQIGNKGNKLPVLKGEKHRIKRRGMWRDWSHPGRLSCGWCGGIPAPVGDWHVRLTWGKSLAWHRLGPARCHPCATAGSGWETSSHVLWGRGASGSLYCIKNHTNITPGSAVLDRNLPRLLLTNKCL